MKDKSYPLPGELPELARLTEQDDCMTNLFQFSYGPLPVYLPPGSVVLDLGCGPGGWARNVASIYPDLHVVGIDENEMYIAHANSKSISQNLPNATFLEGNFLNFDEKDCIQKLRATTNTSPIRFIHARFIKWFAPSYEAAVQYWFDILEPGGYLCLAEGETQVTNSQAFNKLCEQFALALHPQRPNLVGAGVSANMGITIDLYHILLQAGFEAIKEQAYALNFSAKVEGRDAYVKDLSYGFASVGRFLQKVPNVQQLIQESLYDFHKNEDFRGIAYHLASWGRKPLG